MNPLGRSAPSRIVLFSVVMAAAALTAAAVCGAAITPASAAGTASARLAPADLRAKILCTEDTQFTADYHDPETRSIANALTIPLAFSFTE